MRMMGSRSKSFGNSKGVVMETRKAAGEAAETLEGLRLAGRAELAIAFEEHRDRLLRLIALRLDRRLAGRVDPSDIIQDAFIRANAAYDEYCRQSDLPLYNWLRIQAQFAVGDCHRTHLGTQKRAAGMELQAAGSPGAESSEACFAALENLAESMISPGSKVAISDLAAKVREIIEGMGTLDREILILRHIEELSITEAAAELGIGLEAAKKRHLRALRKLQELCDGLTGSSAG